MANREPWHGGSALVVHPVECARHVAKELLRDAGFTEVYMADSVTAGLSLLERLVRVDLVLVDAAAGAGCLDPDLICGAARLLVRVGDDPCPATSSSRQITLEAPLSSRVLLAALARAWPDTEDRPPDSCDFMARPDDVLAAMESGQLSPFFQPVLSLPEGDLCGVEALIRWAHPEYGVLPNRAFVHLLAGGPVASRFFYRFLDDVCAAAQRLAQRHPDAGPLFHAVNLPMAVAEEEGFVERLIAILQARAMPAGRLVLEVAEPEVASRLPGWPRVLARLRLNGVVLALNDCAGRIPLDDLAQGPFSMVRIDAGELCTGQMTSGRMEGGRHRIAACRQRNLQTLAKGVEREADWQQLAALGVDMAQGYHQCRPLPEPLLMEWLSGRGAGLRAG